MVSLSNHDSVAGVVLRQAQDERKLKKSITLHRPCFAIGKPAGFYPSLAHWIPAFAGMTRNVNTAYYLMRTQFDDYGSQFTSINSWTLRFLG